jgi:hypothetical protein
LLHTNIRQTERNQRDKAKKEKDKEEREIAGYKPRKRERRIDGERQQRDRTIDNENLR